MAEGARSGDHPAVLPKRPGAWKAGIGTAAGPTLLFWDSWELEDSGFQIIPQGRGESRKGALPSQLPFPKAVCLDKPGNTENTTEKTQRSPPLISASWQCLDTTQGGSLRSEHRSRPCLEEIRHCFTLIPASSFLLCNRLFPLMRNGFFSDFFF